MHMGVVGVCTWVWVCAHGVGVLAYLNPLPLWYIGVLGLPPVTFNATHISDNLYIIIIHSMCLTYIQVQGAGLLWD